MDIDNLLRFLSELKVNNNREWFAENKTWYDQVRLQFEQMCKELITEISTFDEEIKHVEAKECVFRIYRDTRFSKDKTPYKTHFGVYIASDGGPRVSVPVIIYILTLPVALLARECGVPIR